jgi:DNA polymerase II large subunit
MLEKVDAQLELGRKIRAVNVDGVAGLVLGTHFLSDIKGNIRTFTRQKIRCITCNSKYRRVPLTGVCTRCGGKLILTVAPGSVSKYIAPSMRIAENFKITPYLNQQLEVASRRLLSMFGKEKHQQVGLDTFLSK